MSPNPIMGDQPVQEARKLIRSGTARELGEQILPDVAVSNIDWLIQDANRCHKRCPTCQKALEDASDDAQATP
jgi:hypothetical protein